MLELIASIIGKIIITLVIVFIAFIVIIFMNLIWDLIPDWLQITLVSIVALLCLIVIDLKIWGW